MINKIILKSVNSFKNETTLETNKKVNLIYGLNGVGKSTFSNFLRDIHNPNYTNCSLINFDETREKIIVYNQVFVEENFYTDSIKGIFSLSKGNKDAKEAINKAKAEINTINEEISKKKINQGELKSGYAKCKQSATIKVWDIKKKYTGGDRILDYCFQNLKSSQDKLFDFLKQRSKSEKKPEITIEQIKEEVQALNANSIQQITELKRIQNSIIEIETSELFTKTIVSSDNSTFSDLIKTLDNSDWVVNGIQFIEKQNKETLCPFCQQKIESKENFLQELQKCFDTSYQNDKEELLRMISNYSNFRDSLSKELAFENLTILSKLKNEYDKEYQQLCSELDKNILLMKEKIQYPSKQIVIQNSSNIIVEINKLIDKANSEIKIFNAKLQKKDETENHLKNEFWDIMRWDYDQTIDAFNLAEQEYLEKAKTLETELKNKEDAIKEKNNSILEKQKDVVNIDDAIRAINSNLVDLGIDSFCIEKYGEDLYQIKRDNQSENIFKSLSEGEKMIISFLYFIEECKGKESVSENEKRKIIVIDDPISSLSHIYVFNIGRFIQKEFINSNKYEQVFILSHSLYFFYELAKKPIDTERFTDEEKEKAEKKKQNLYRIQKNENGSFFIPMKYNEIQNDYHAYWCIIKDKTQSPALIANCMRNIIDHFFSFIEKKDLNEVFQKPELSTIKYQSFNRYINRESHSDGQNIFDIKEFDYDIFQEAFRLVFELTNYSEHYKRMIKS